MSGVMIFWLSAVILLAIIEIATIQLVAIWLAFGGVGALIAASLGMPMPVQFAVFIVISAVLLILTRPLVRKFIKTEKVNTNADRLVGSVAVVGEDIDNLASKGTAVISGITWMARSADGSVIRSGERVIVNRIEGVKLIVSKAESNPL